MFSRRSFLLVVAILCLGGGAGLFIYHRVKPSEPAQPGPRRIALLPFENQTGDASLDWPERLIPLVATRQLGSLPQVTGFHAEQANEAVALGATHLVYGYFTQSKAGPVVRAFVEDARQRKVVAERDLPLRNQNWVEILRAISAEAAGQVAPGSKPAAMEIHNDAAARAMAGAIAAETPRDRVAGYEASISADPRCGWCWEGLIDGLGKLGDNDAVLQAIARSREQGKGMSALSRARLDLAQAMLTRNQAERAAALERITQAAPNDVASLLQLSQVDVALQRYDKAAEAGHKAVQVAPFRAELWNNYAYNLAYLGKYKEAQAAVQQYGRLDMESANPLDSEGEILLMAGQFADAAKALQASYDKDKTYNDGDALQKAALAHWLNGDKDAAKALLERYFEDREKANDAWLELSKARWEYLFGQTGQARNRMRALAERKDHPVAAFAAAVLALHELAEGHQLAAQVASRTARDLAKTAPQRLYAAVASLAVEPDSKEVQISDAGLRGEARALGLTARGDWKAASAEWQTLYKEQPGGTTAPYRELLAYSLVQSGQAAQAAGLVSKDWPLLSREQQLLYDFLLYPNLFYTRAEVALAAKKPAEAQRDYDRFLQYAGDRDDRFGQLARARSAARL